LPSAGLQNSQRKLLTGHPQDWRRFQQPTARDSVLDGPGFNDNRPELSPSPDGLALPRLESRRRSRPTVLRRNPVRPHHFRAKTPFAVAAACPLSWGVAGLTYLLPAVIRRRGPARPIRTPWLRAENALAVTQGRRTDDRARREQDKVNHCNRPGADLTAGPGRGAINWLRFSPAYNHECMRGPTARTATDRYKTECLRRTGRQLSYELSRSATAARRKRLTANAGSTSYRLNGDEHQPNTAGCTKPTTLAGSWARFEGSRKNPPWVVGPGLRGEERPTGAWLGGGTCAA